MTSNHLPINRDASPRPNENFVIRRHSPNLYVCPGPISTNGRHTRQQLNQVLNCLAAAAYGKSLQNLCDENEKCDDKSRKSLANRQSSDDGDSHRKLHRHSPLSYVFVGFVEDRKAANQSAYYTDGSYVGIRRAAKKPNSPRCRSDEQDAVDLSPSRRMPVVVIVFLLGTVGRGVFWMCFNRVHCMRFFWIPLIHDFPLFEQLGRLSVVTSDRLEPPRSILRQLVLGGSSFYFRGRGHEIGRALP